MFKTTYQLKNNHNDQFKMYSISHEKLGYVNFVGGGIFQTLNSGFREGSKQVPFIKINRLFTPLLQLFGKTLKDTVDSTVDGRNPAPLFGWVSVFPLKQTRSLNSLNW